uniref:DNA alkylation repair protein n=1 Tax=Roseihalotalea indica TaxID=2867963 RepID=A0AA49JH15_9BACT|nr:DNA alkylation repair protein [Tunicatimonas sp. TK19036]
MEIEELLTQLHHLADPAYLPKMQRFGIPTEQALGIRMPLLRQLAKPYRKQHQLALDLWEQPIHEARLLATLVDDPKQVTDGQMEAWVTDIRSWDLCDQACGNLFWNTPYAYDKAITWCQRPEEFVKRAGFVLMVELVIHDKKATDEQILAFFPYLEAEAHDERNFVKKAISWMIRQTGKRNLTLHQEALALANRLSTQDNRPAQWIYRDVMKELRSESVLKRLQKNNE